MSIKATVADLIRKHGGIRPAATATGIDPGYMYRLWKGAKSNPSDETLAKLGLEKSVTYKVRK